MSGPVLRLRDRLKKGRPEVKHGVGASFIILLSSFLGHLLYLAEEGLRLLWGSGLLGGGQDRPASEGTGLTVQSRVLVGGALSEKLVGGIHVPPLPTVLACSSRWYANPQLKEGKEGERGARREP